MGIVFLNEQHFRNEHIFREKGCRSEEKNEPWTNEIDRLEV